MKALPVPLFYTRDFSKVPMPDTRLKFRTTRLLYNVMGWCDQADVDVSGPELDLWGLMDYLRRPVEFWDGLGLCWWGYVNELILHLRQHDLSFSLDTMANRIAVSYTWVGTGVNADGVQKLTAFTTDANSISEYGTKETILSVDTMTTSAAEALRDARLAAYSRPAGCPEPARNETVYATLYCRGWWQTLEWRLAKVDPVANISYTTVPSPAQEQAVGSAAAFNKVAQSFTVGGSAIDAFQVQVYAKKNGDPTGELRLSLYAVDAGGLPTGDSLFSGTILPSDISASLAWVGLLAEQTTLAAGTQYSLVVDCTGGNDAVNYYSIGVNSAKGYAGGVLKIWNMSSWVNRSVDADMLFSIDVNAQLTIDTQIENLLTNFSQFTTTKMCTASTIVQGSYMAGDTPVLQAVEDYLQIGGANGRRHTVRVDEWRRVYIYEEIAQPATSLWSVTPNGITYSGREMRLHECRDLLGLYINAEQFPLISGSYNVLGLQYVESIEWTPDQGIQPRYKGRPAPEELTL